jgi:uncharacterized protein (DUF4415 family)
MTPKPNPDMIDNDAPEADDAWFAKARPASEVLPAIMSTATAAEALKRGRPKSESAKKLVSLRLDADLVERMRSSGEGPAPRPDAACPDRWTRRGSRHRRSAVPQVAQTARNAPG